MVDKALGVVWLHYLCARVGEQGSFESDLVYPCTPEASFFLIKTTILQTPGVGRKLSHMQNSPLSMCSLGMGDEECLLFKEYFKIFYNCSLTMHSNRGFFTCLNMVFLCWAMLVFHSLSSSPDTFLLTNFILTSCLILPYIYIFCLDVLKMH